jgi:hypothetical protein
MEAPLSDGAPKGEDREDPPVSLFQVQTLRVGQLKLRVRLCGDMDEKFLDRLGNILKLETRP